ncbi:MAG TPA: HTH domain-containing protein [Blastocatellia bacterium]|nr:HTH domain-containing protein [Blastocatellia bacterium]
MIRQMSHCGDLTHRLAEAPYLLSERPWTVSQLATHFDVDKKTIRRTVTALSRFHPIVENRQGREISYGFEEGRGFRSQSFTAAELATLLLAEETIGVIPKDVVPLTLADVRSHRDRAIQQAQKALASETNTRVSTH